MSLSGSSHDSIRLSLKSLRLSIPSGRLLSKHVNVMSCVLSEPYESARFTPSTVLTSINLKGDKHDIALVSSCTALLTSETKVATGIYLLVYK